MAEHRPWLKLWTKALTDPDLVRLSMQDRGRWFWLLLHVGLHGERGVLALRHGIGDLCELFADEPGEDQSAAHSEPTPGPPAAHVKPRARDVRRYLKRLPGVHLQEASFPDSQMTLTFTKWSKYQVDDSTERVQRWRQKRRIGNVDSPLRGNDNSPLLAPVGNGARREEIREEPPTPLAPHPFDTTPPDADHTNQAHLRFNIPD